jgi:hypothetical protein
VLCVESCLEQLLCTVCLLVLNCIVLGCVVGHWARLSQWFVGRTDAQLMKRYRFLLDRAAGAETVVADAASVTVGHLSSNRMGRIKKH